MQNYYPYAPTFNGYYQPQPNYSQSAPTTTNSVPQQPTPQNVNKIYVTSLEDALGRYSNPNTITVYHLQDESGEIEIATDGFGKKSYKMRKLTDFTPPETDKTSKDDYVSISQYKTLETRLSALESKLNKGDIIDA